MPKYRRLFLFNPENEMAIANGNPYYTPPATILKMAEDLAYLPAYYAGEEDAVWVKNGLKENSWKKEKHGFIFRLH